MAGLLDMIGMPAGLLGIGGMPFDEQNFRRMQPGGLPDWLRTAVLNLPPGAGFGPDEASSAPRAPMPMAPQPAAPMVPPVTAPQLDGDNNPIPGMGLLSRAAPQMTQPSPVASPAATPAMAPPSAPSAPAPSAGLPGAGMGAGLGDRLIAGIGGLASGGPVGLLRGLMGGQTGTPRQQAYAMLVQQGVDPQTAMLATTTKEVFQNFVANRLKPQGTDDIREYEYAKSQGFKGTFADWQAHKRAGAGEFSLQPIYGKDKDGNTVIMQLGKSGEAIRSRLPADVTVSTGVDRIDLGTQWALQDKRSGQIVGYLPKDIEGKKAAEARGEVQGQAQAELPAVEMTANRTIKQIDEFMNSEGFNEVFGALDQFRPNWTMSDKGREALARFKQLSGRAFLEGRAMLKGGGAITDFESNKAESAIARLERSLSEDDARAALRDFQDAVREGAAKLRAKAGGGAPAPAAAPAASASVPAPPPGFQLVN